MLEKISAGIKNLPKKYVYVLVLLVAGLLLLLLPSRSQEADETVSAAVESFTDTSACERRLAEILSETAGVGDARVMLTLERDVRRTYARETETEQETESGGGQQFAENSALAMQDSGSDTLPITETVEAPVFRGAVIACEGGDRAEIRLCVTQAVMAVTGLSSDRITVLKLS